MIVLCRNPVRFTNLLEIFWTTILLELMTLEAYFMRHRIEGIEPVSLLYLGWFEVVNSFEYQYVGHTFLQASYLNSTCWTKNLLYPFIDWRHLFLNWKYIIENVQHRFVVTSSMSMLFHANSLSGRAFHHYRHQKEPLKKHPELDQLLRDEYRSLEDFRAREKSNTLKEEIH